MDHSYYHPSNYLGHLQTVPPPSSNNLTQLGNPRTISAGDQWRASYLIHGINHGYIDRSAWLSEAWSDRSERNLL
jgi:hypothetical protein